MIPREFTAIWFHPRQVIAAIVARDPSYWVLPLAVLSGIGNALDRASLKSAGDRVEVTLILLLVLVFGALGGLVTLYLGSWLLRWTGKWIGGVADASVLRTVIAWASVPSVAALPLWIPQGLLFGKELFTTETPRLDAQPWLWVPFMAMALVEMALAFWSLWILAQGLAEVQGFRSAWKGFLNAVLAVFLVVIPLVIVTLLVILVS